MAQLSRPFQVALAAVVLIALLWFAVLRGHNGGAQTPSPSQSASSAPSAGNSAAEEAKQAAEPSPEYKGSAPGLKGLSRALNKAHEAVGTSQREAKALETASAESSTSAGSGGASTVTTGGTTAGGAHSPTSASGSGVQAHSPAGSRSKAGGASSTSSTHATTRIHSVAGHGHANKGLSRPTEIANELEGGKVVLLLFWNPRSADDVSVHHELGVVSRELKGKVAVHYASAHEVGSFGTVTRDVSVYQTPTLLVIGSNRLVTTITGLTDAFSIKQAVKEAKG